MSVRPIRPVLRRAPKPSHRRLTGADMINPAFDHPVKAMFEIAIPPEKRTKRAAREWLTHKFRLVGELPILMLPNE